MPTSTYRDIAEIIEQVQAGRAAPVYLIAGDPFLSRQVHQQLLEALLPDAIGALNGNWWTGRKRKLPP